MNVDTKSRLVESAIKLFALHGYDGTTTKQICDNANANIAALHYHFESKENLYLSIIQQFGNESLGSALRTLSAPSSLEELRTRLEMFLHEVLALCLQNIDLVRIVQNETEHMNERSQTVVQNTFMKMFESLVSFFADASKKKLLATGVDPMFAASSIFSQLSQAIRGEPAAQKYLKITLQDMAYRKKWVHAVVQMFLEGVQKR